MTTPRRLLRPVTEPAPGDDQPRPAEHPAPAEVVPLTARIAPAEAGEAPGDGVNSPSHDGSGAEAIGGFDPTPGAAFLKMVERAEKVAPIRADTAELPPGALLEMIGGVADPPPGGPHGDDPQAQRAAEAALERLATAAWEVIRTGAADGKPELRTPLVEICTRLSGMDSGMDPEEHQED